MVLGRGERLGCLVVGQGLGKTRLETNHVNKSYVDASLQIGSMCLDGLEAYIVEEALNNQDENMITLSLFIPFLVLWSHEKTE